MGDCYYNTMVYTATLSGPAQKAKIAAAAIAAQKAKLAAEAHLGVYSVVFGGKHPYHCTQYTYSTADPTKVCSNKNFWSNEKLLGPYIDKSCAEQGFVVSKHEYDLKDNGLKNQAVSASPWAKVPETKLELDCYYNELNFDKPSTLSSVVDEIVSMPTVASSLPFVGVSSKIINSGAGCQEYIFTDTDPSKVCSIKTAHEVNSWWWRTKPLSCKDQGYTVTGSEL